MSLSQQEIKEQELILLQVSGFCLAEYSDAASKSLLFREVAPSSRTPLLTKLNAQKIRNVGLSSNANLKAFAYVLLQSVFGSGVKQDLLDCIKSSLYSEAIQLEAVRHHPLMQHSDRQMKKLAVEFFYSVTYCHLEGRVEQKLSKYPVILQIMVVYLRRMLFGCKVSNADDYIFHLATSQVYSLLVQCFDLNCRQEGSLFLFDDEQLFIHENEHGEIFFGSYRQNEEPLAFNNLRNTFAFQEINEAEEKSSQNDSDEHQTPNRSLEIRGVVSESLVFDPETATPFFNLDHHPSSFQHSGSSSLHSSTEFHRELANAGASSPLKKMDQLQTSQHLGLGANHLMKRTLVFDEEPSNNDPNLFQQIAESPITIDSRHTLEMPEERSFPSRTELSVEGEKTNVLKKSKSEIMSNAKQNGQPRERSRDGASEKRKNTDKKSQHSATRNKTCHCVQNKKKKIKLSSKLYQINMSYIQPASFSKKPSALHIESRSGLPGPATPNATRTHNKTFTDHHSEFDRSFSRETVFRKVNRVFHRKNPLEISMNSISMGVMYNPESDSFSKRTISPVSNNSVSPHQGNSTTPPKVKFTYKNPLSFSTHRGEEQKIRKYSRV